MWNQTPPPTQKIHTSLLHQINQSSRPPPPPPSPASFVHVVFRTRQLCAGETSLRGRQTAPWTCQQQCLYDIYIKEDESSQVFYDRSLATDHPSIYVLSHRDRSLFLRVLGRRKKIMKSTTARSPLGCAWEGDHGRNSSPKSPTRGGLPSSSTRMLLLLPSYCFGARDGMWIHCGFLSFQSDETAREASREEI